MIYFCLWSSSASKKCSHNYIYNILTTLWLNSQQFWLHDLHYHVTWCYCRQLLCCCNEGGYHYLTKPCVSSCHGLKAGFYIRPSSSAGSSLLSPMCFFRMDFFLNCRITSGQLRHNGTWMLYYSSRGKLSLLSLSCKEEANLMRLVTDVSFTFSLFCLCYHRISSWCVMYCVCDVFLNKGCDSVMKLSELGSHSLDCPHRPTGDLDAKVSMKD